MPFKNIVVALDGSPHSESALSTAIEVAKRFDGRLHGIHVIDLAMLETSIVTDLSGSVGFQPFINLTAELRGALASAAEAILASFEARCGEVGVPADATTEEGVVAAIIERRGRTADLVALGGRGAGSRHRKDLLGGNAESLIRRLTVPAVVCPEEYRPFSAPLLAYDGSVKAAHALRLAGEAAAGFGLPLEILAVTDADSRARQLREEAKASLEAYGCAVEFSSAAGHPDEEILKAVAGGKNPLFMGSHGHGRIIELVLGSTTERVLRKAEVPVFLAT